MQHYYKLYFWKEAASIIDTYFRRNVLNCPKLSADPSRIRHFKGEVSPWRESYGLPPPPQASPHKFAAANLRGPRVERGPAPATPPDPSVEEPPGGVSKPRCNHQGPSVVRALSARTPEARRLFARCPRERLSKPRATADRRFSRAAGSSRNHGPQIATYPFVASILI